MPCLTNTEPHAQYPDSPHMRQTTLTTNGHGFEGHIGMWVGIAELGLVGLRIAKVLEVIGHEPNSTGYVCVDSDDDNCVVRVQFQRDGFNNTPDAFEVPAEFLIPITCDHNARMWE